MHTSLKLFFLTLQFATHASLPGKPYDEYYGFVATIDVYGYNISLGQLSASSIWVANVGNWSKESFNSIRVGWMVSNTLYLYKMLLASECFQSRGFNLPLCLCEMTNPFIYTLLLVFPIHFVTTKNYYVIAINSIIIFILHMSACLTLLHYPF